LPGVLPVAWGDGIVGSLVEISILDSVSLCDVDCVIFDVCVVCVVWKKVRELEVGVDAFIEVFRN